MNKCLLGLLVVLFNYNVHALELTEASVNGEYYLGVPERGKSKVLMQYGQLGNKTVIAVAACQSCPPAVYSFQEEPSKTLGTPVFMTSGLYLIPLNENSFVLVQPDGLLGRKVWSKIGHANLYTRDQQAAANFDRASVEKFAIDLSHKIMNQEVGEMAHSGGEYFLAVPQKHGGKIQSSYSIEFNEKGKKSVLVKPCDSCSMVEYKILPEESGVIGVDVYRNASSYYLFDLKDGVLVYTFANASGFGRTEWSKHSKYNVYSNNQAYIRKILQSKQMQNTLDSMMGEYFAKAKSYFEQKALAEKSAKDAARELPKEGLVYSDKQQLLDAASRWAQAWSWKESLIKTYLTQSDWSITRNRLTGIITGKVIGGVVIMKHPDGRCRYQMLNYRQDYDGSSYTNLQVSGIGPIYDFACDKL